MKQWGEDPGRSQWTSVKEESSLDGLAVAAERAVEVDARKDKGCTQDGGHRRGGHHIPRYS